MKEVRLEILHRERRFSLLGFENDLISKHIEDTRTFYELEILEYIRSKNLEGVYVDVGAHIGNHSLFFAHICRSTAVWAFEPNPKTFALTERNLSGAPSCVLKNLAVHNEWPKVDLILGPKNNTGATRVRPGNTIEAVALDDVLHRESKVACLKVDVEGFEQEVLLSALEIIQAHRPLIVAEAWNQSAFEAQKRVLGPLKYRSGPRFDGHPSRIWEPV